MPRSSLAGNFRQNLFNGKLDLILEAHSGLSARIVEEAGFSAIWASGLSIASALGLRDCNEASWSQVVEVTQAIHDVVNIPILFDGDSGFGNFNNVRHIVKRLSNYGIAGISLEDKSFPKMNSFVSGDHVLSSVEEFCGKIKAAQDTKCDDRFTVIARTEALIAGLGVDVALKRAEQYHEAGADGIFIHSRARDAQDVVEFGRRWQGRSPLVVAPTTYIDTPLALLEQVGVSIYICANQLMRASVHAMRRAARQIRQDNSISTINSDISPLADVFSLLDYDELKIAERIYAR
ncbi:phosphoenolpyruvate mutase [Pseudomonas guariconensis]|uniref:phosphoenolpyruvate mutase n=1 Tax=Pseudomonas TaxID=286 RepID=UPI0020980D28|nr:MULTISPECIES: phosphoenolpyruvate mutase [Pseudomonas]MCO7643108.1 phosphoenolpyruvate mutase [Pseudomonas sp. S 311-6]MCO7514845.1 phosphoenolpyruvate mutase [Pseudomonas putida]MCO7565846.1 phosphoenolpyruvate mutase [Pseudomonas mosselii]MCO7605304.1 phosphoenolpyruvate mutase [Pseudomonas guariconensis]MCO7616852.1 phosphoenolpyruvate mutase [Pseudomonas guariconensis]